MMNENRDWNDYNRKIGIQGRQILERTGESIQRSHQIAIETETIGTEVISELNDQREALLRTRTRLENADEQLDSAKAILRKMGRNVIYNRLILILIIMLEIGILIGISYIKFIK